MAIKNTLAAVAVASLAGLTLADSTGEAEHRSRMEACLTVVRKVYSTEDGEVQSFVEAHPTRAKGELMNKVLARMTMKCLEEMSAAEKETLLTYKHDPVALPVDSYLPLVAIDFDELAYKGDPESADAQAPVY